MSEDGTPRRRKRRREGMGFTWHLDECPKSRGSISGCICRDDKHRAKTQERDDTTPRKVRPNIPTQEPT